jgi:UDP:flavonoid glycosyltransferase YjiC (YdhE family)
MGVAAKSMAVQGLRNGLNACQGSDLIIGGVAGFFTGFALAEKLNLPFIPAFYFPFTPTREFPNALVPLPPVRLPGWANRLTHRMAQQMLWLNFRSADNRARQEVLGLSPESFGGPFAAWEKRNGTVLYGYSSQVIPRPVDWPDCIHVTGYWFLEPDPAWQPPIELARFLEAGSPPVYIGFGSMGSSKGEATTALILKALEMSGQRGVLLSSNLRDRSDRLPPNVFVIDSVPFDWLFPRMAAVVHHGGAGTTSMGLRAGVPAVVTPFMGDQPFWARRVHELGAGPRPIPRRHLTAERLAEAIHTAVSDRSMAEAAARLGEHIRAENGVAEAVAIVEQSLI